MKERGFSFIETLIVILILSVVTAAVFTLTFQGQKTFKSQKDFNETVREARVAMDQMVRYLRQAGNDPFGALTVPPIQIVGPGHIQINADITGTIPSTTTNVKESTGDPDGTLNSIGEKVVVRLAADQKKLYIDIGYGEQLVAENISSLTFTFYDLSGAVTTVPSAVARVKVRLVADTNFKDPSRGKINTVTFESDVFLRSKAFDLY